MKKILLLAAAIAACSPLTGMERTHVSRDVLEHELFPCCDQNTLLTCRLVCSCWNQTVEKHSEQQPFRIHVTYIIANKKLKMDDLFTSFKKSNCFVMIHTIKKIKSCREKLVKTFKNNLIGLDLSLYYGNEWNERIHNNDLRFLKDFTKLETLLLIKCEKISNQALKTFPITLKKLSLEECDKIKKRGLKTIAGRFSLLEDLDLSGCSKITDNGLSCLKKLKQLRILKLYNNNKLTSDGFAWLKTAENFTTLIVKFCNNTTIGLVAHLPKTTLVLELIGCCGVEKTSDLQHFTRLQSLQELNIQTSHGNTIDDKAFSHLPKTLKKLILNHFTSITSQVLMHIQSRVLEELTLSSCKSINKNGRLCAQLPESLSKLHLLSGDIMTDNDISQLQNKTNLRVLTLSLCKQITDDALKFLPPDLKELVIDGCPQITTKGISLLPGEIKVKFLK